MIQTIIVAIVVTAAVGYAFRRIRKLSQRSGTCCGCEGCDCSCCVPADCYCKDSKPKQQNEGQTEK